MKDQWRQHIEFYKFVGPTIKLMELEPGLWAILDHEYNLCAVCPYDELSWRILEVTHPPQRERPKPIMPQDSFEPKPTQRFNINTEDLDL